MKVTNFSTLFVGLVASITLSNASPLTNAQLSSSLVQRHYQEYADILPNITVSSVTNIGHTNRTDDQWYKPRGKKMWKKLEKHIVISRDCGRAEMMSKRRFFMFCDSEVQQISEEDSYKIEGADKVKPNLVAFVANSFAYDNSREMPSAENPIRLAETGMWDESGRIVNWISLTQEEKDYNHNQQVQSNQGALTKGRNAVWIDSPIVEISENHGFLYAPVVNVEVTKGKAHVFNYLGTSLVNVTFKNHLLEAPKTTRIVPYLFGPEDINFGSLGSGYWGGNWVYVFGTTKAANSESGGIVVARVARYSEEYKDRYQYWDGCQWTATALEKDNVPEAAIIIPGIFSRPTIIFSQLHGTFIIVYTKGNLESKFYMRKLLVPTRLELATPGLPLSSYLWDWVPEQIVKNAWSSEEFIYEAEPVTEGSFSFAGSIALGYLADQDLKNGGDKLMLVWTGKTLARAWQGPNGEYEAGIAIVEFKESVEFKKKESVEFKESASNK